MRDYQESATTGQTHRQTARRMDEQTDAHYASQATQKLWYHVKSLVNRNTHMQYESPISSGLKVMAKVKIFVHAANAGDADARAI